jgi:hypothetical protein
MYYLPSLLLSMLHLSTTPPLTANLRFTLSFHDYSYIYITVPGKHSHECSMFLCFEQSFQFAPLLCQHLPEILINN